jgi:peptidase E
MRNSTLKDLSDFASKEKKMLDDLHLQIENVSSNTPSDYTLNNILNYSKVLSVRKSENIKHIKMLLN